MADRFQNKYRIPSARLRNWDYSAEGIYFITICTAGHECYFGEIVNKKMVLSEIGSLVQVEWEKSFVIRSELFCDYYVIMPNHIHAIVRIEDGIFKYPSDELNEEGMHCDNNKDGPETHHLETHHLETDRMEKETHGSASLQDDYLPNNGNTIKLF